MGSLLALIAGCGESFVAATEAGGGTTTGTGLAGGGGTGASSTTAGGSGGSGAATSTGTSTLPGDCTDGETQSCYDGPPESKNVGACKEGTQLCAGGTWGTCKGQVVPADEVCDDAGLDESCNGTKNEGCACTTGSQQNCYGGSPGTEEVGPCKGGVQSCIDGVWSECIGQQIDKKELCDGIDNDCNDVLDDVAGLGGVCMTGQPGICSPGTLACKPGMSELSCPPNEEPATEICDNLDNDCNGMVDESFPGADSPCPASVGNVTCSGTFACVNGQKGCFPNRPYLVDDFSGGSLQWTMTGDWMIGATAASPAPNAGFPDPALDHSPTADNKLAGTHIGGLVSPNIGSQYLTSKVLDDLAALDGTLYLSFWRWLNVDGASTVATVEVWNGSQWVVLWKSPGLLDPSGDPAGVFDNAWKPMAFNITSYKNNELQVRFGLAVGVNLQSVSGWNVDDVALTSCPLPNAMLLP